MDLGDQPADAPVEGNTPVVQPESRFGQPEATGTQPSHAVVTDTDTATASQTDAAVRQRAQQRRSASVDLGATGPHSSTSHRSSGSAGARFAQHRASSAGPAAFRGLLAGGESQRAIPERAHMRTVRPSDPPFARRTVFDVFGEQPHSGTHAVRSNAPANRMAEVELEHAPTDGLNSSQSRDTVPPELPTATYPSAVPVPVQLNCGSTTEQSSRLEDVKEEPHEDEPEAQPASSSVHALHGNTASPQQQHQNQQPLQPRQDRLASLEEGQLPSQQQRSGPHIPAPLLARSEVRH